MSFGDPRMLWALLAVPLWALIEFAAVRRARGALERLVGERGDTALLAQLGPRQRVRGALLRLGALLALIIGAAGPQWGREVVRRGATGSDVVLVVDVSASMDARDVPPSRLDEARREALAVVGRLGGSRVGVVAFAGDAVRLCPLTLDHAAARLTVEGLTSFAVAEPGTDLGKGLRSALSLLPSGRRSEQVMVLWTDGEDLEQGAATAIEEVVRTGVRVFAVGVGTPAGAVVPALDDQGRAVDVRRDENGVAVRSRLDEALLRSIARRSHGAYFAASRPGGELARLLGALGAVAQSGRGNRLIERPAARFQWFAALAALLLVLERARARRRRAADPALSGSERARAAARTEPKPAPAAAAAAAVLALAVLAAPWSARTAHGQSAWAKGDAAFRKQRFAEADSLYTRRLKDRRAPLDVRLNRATSRALAGRGPEGIAELDSLARRGGKAGHEAIYNLGTLLGDSKQVDPALAALRRALERDPNDEDARWNWEVLQQEKERQQKPQQQPKPQPQPQNPQPSPSQPQQQSPRSVAPQQGQQPPQAPQNLERAQAEQILGALDELQRMEQQRQRKVRVLKERRGRDW